MRSLALVPAALVAAGAVSSLAGPAPDAASPQVAAAAEVPSAGTTRVVVEAEAWGEGRTPAEARREALDRARALAVERVAGIRVSAQDLRLRSEGSGGAPVDAFASLVRTSTWGRIVREDVVHETAVVAGVPVYRVRLDADVVVERGEPDPGFTLAIAPRPDAHAFHDGQPVAFELTASRDCFVHLFNVLPDGRVVPIDVAADRRPVPLMAGKPARLPPPGSVLRARLGAGLPRAYEQVLAIATVDALQPLLDVPRPEGDFPATPSGPDAAESWNALNRWLLGIPVDRRTEALWGYEVLP